MAIPPEELNLLDRQSVLKLQEMLDWYNRVKGLAAVRGDRVQPHKAPDCYIARIPYDGIPALTIGTPDIAGSATCDIYRATLNGSSWEIEAIDDLEKTVLNTSLTRITGRYAIVQRLKGAPWVAQYDPTLSTTSEIPDIISSYSDLETWKQVNIDNTLVSHGLLTAYGPFSLTSFSNDIAVGVNPWSNPSNAASSNDSRSATANLHINSRVTNYLKALQLPGGYAPDASFVPTVVHITVEGRNGIANDTIKDSEVKLVVGGTVQATNKASDIPWQSTDFTKIYRIETTASRAQTLAADFGLVINAEYTGPTDTFQLLNNLINDSTLSPGWTTYWGDSVSWVGSASSSSDGNVIAGGTNAYALNGSGTGNGSVKSARTTYTPSSSGAFSQISGTISTAGAYASLSSSPAPGETITLSMILIQNHATYGNSTYTAEIGSAISKSPQDDGSSPSHWTARTFSFTAEDFTRQAGTGPLHPDFTSTGLQITFGFAISKTGTSCDAWSLYFDDVVVNLENVTQTVPGGTPQIDHIQIKVLGRIP